jgi:hypothetical protein
MQVVLSMDSVVLENCVVTDGVLTEQFDRLLTFTPGYSPPEWLDFSYTLDSPSTTPVDITDSQQQQLFDPMQHLGITPTEFEALAFYQMKQLAMAKLPLALASHTNLTTIRSILTALQETPRSKFLALLTLEIFTRYLTPQSTISTQHYYRLRLCSFNSKRNALWASSPGAILSHWLQAAAPVLLQRYPFALSLPPHLANQNQMEITSHLTIPPIQSLEHYTLDVHRDRENYVLRLDFWILTSCPDIDMTLPLCRSDALGTAPRKYASDLF